MRSIPDIVRPSITSGSDGGGQAFDEIVHFKHCSVGRPKTCWVGAADRSVERIPGTKLLQHHHRFVPY
jgi:hypothetical protein